jgi:hypothetical protein
MVDWHCLRHTAFALKSLFERRADLRFERLWIEFKDHVTLCAWRLANYSAGPRTFLALTGLDGAAEEPHRARYVERGGFEALDEEDAERGGRRDERQRRFLSNLQDFERYVAELRLQFEERTRTWPSTTRMTRRQRELAEEAGVRIVFVMPPGCLRDPEVEGLKVAGELPGVLWFQDPERYPRFYELDVRFDLNHFNTAGAREFCEIFAEAVAPMVKGS